MSNVCPFLDSPTKMIIHVQQYMHVWYHIYRNRNTAELTLIYDQPYVRMSENLGKTKKSQGGVLFRQDTFLVAETREKECPIFVFLIFMLLLYLPTRERASRNTRIYTT